MRTAILAVIYICLIQTSHAQDDNRPAPIRVMTLGVFHFDYPNLDVIKTDEKDRISVTDEPYQSEILALCDALQEFSPTVVAVEYTPDLQHRLDSLYSLYRADKLELKKSEVFQLGFRIAKQSNIDRVFCVDDQGRHYENMQAIFADSVRLSQFERYYMNPPDSTYLRSKPAKKIQSIIDALHDGNSPDRIREGLASYLYHPFKYEEQPGDFTGVDFESGRWYNRNLRIFRNVQRLSRGSEDRILLIIGSEHLNLLNLFFDVSREFELVSPLPYLEKARRR